MSEHVPILKDGDIVRVMQTTQMVKNGCANKVGIVRLIHTHQGSQACMLDGPEFDESIPFFANSLMKMDGQADWLRRFHPEFMQWLLKSR